jgi:hypothetical protein
MRSRNRPHVRLDAACASRDTAAGRPSHTVSRVLVPTWSPARNGDDLGDDRSAEQKKPSDLAVKPNQRASMRPSGRQDSNLRPLDPQTGPQRTMTCKNRETSAQHRSVEVSLQQHKHVQAEPTLPFFSHSHSHRHHEAPEAPSQRHNQNSEVSQQYMTMLTVLLRLPDGTWST